MFVQKHLEMIVRQCESIRLALDEGMISMEGSAKVQVASHMSHQDIIPTKLALLLHPLREIRNKNSTTKSGGLVVRENHPEGLVFVYSYSCANGEV
jgi:hypothetical protein